MKRRPMQRTWRLLDQCIEATPSPTGFQHASCRDSAHDAATDAYRPTRRHACASFLLPRRSSRTACAVDKCTSVPDCRRMRLSCCSPSSKRSGACPMLNRYRPNCTISQVNRTSQDVYYICSLISRSRPGTFLTDKTDASGKAFGSCRRWHRAARRSLPSLHRLPACR